MLKTFRSNVSTWISMQVSKGSSWVYIDRQGKFNFYLILAMKILIPRPCLLSSGMKVSSCLPAQSKYTFSRDCQVSRLQSFLSSAHQAAVGNVCSRSAGISAVELRSLHKINLLLLYCSHRFVHSNTGACVDILPSSQTGLAVK